MGWRELLAWLGAIKRQREGTPTSPDSWAGTERDPWWQEARRKRAEQQGLLETP